MAGYLTVSGSHTLSGTTHLRVDKCVWNKCSLPARQGLMQWWMSGSCPCEMRSPCGSQVLRRVARSQPIQHQT